MPFVVRGDDKFAVCAVNLRSGLVSNANDVPHWMVASDDQFFADRWCRLSNLWLAADGRR
jgi:hypothetical protein